MSYCKVCKGRGWFQADCEIKEDKYKFTTIWDCTCDNSKKVNVPPQYFTYHKWVMGERKEVSWYYADPPSDYDDKYLSREQRAEALRQLKELLKGV